MSIQVLHGDCLALLPTLAAGSVQCCVTSPPYFGLRDYGTGAWSGGDAACDHRKAGTHVSQASTLRSDGRAHVGPYEGEKAVTVGYPYGRDCPRCGATRTDSQIGLESTPDAYIAALVSVFREVRRVLTDTGVVFLNLGDSYSSGSQHAAACGKRGKALEDSQASDCLCGSLCGACRAAYRLGKYHTGSSRAATPSPSIALSSLGRKESQRDRLPKSGLVRQDDHIEAANPDKPQHSRPVDEPLHAFLASTTPGYGQQPRADCSQTGSSSACLLCGLTVSTDAPASSRMMVDPSSLPLACVETQGLPKSKHDTLETVGSFADRTSGTVCDYCLPHQCYGTPHHHSSIHKPKDLLMIPARVALALRADGWFLRSDIIWAKPNPMPESVTDRPTSSHEHVFLLTKRARYFYDAPAIAEPSEPSSVSRLSQNVADQTGSDRANGGHKTNGPMRAVGGETRNARNVWIIATQPYSSAHFATMPPELAERCIKAGSRPGDTILDPFAGAGTTSLVADRLQRHGIGIELNPTYGALARTRIANDAPLFAEVS